VLGVSHKESVDADTNTARQPEQAPVTITPPSTRRTRTFLHPTKGLLIHLYCYSFC